MPRTRKPNPKSQKQISNDLVNPYVNPDNGDSYGNPNIPSNFDQFTANEQNGVGFNRSNQLSFKGDTTKPFTIGFEDIDEAIHYYFSNVIRPSVVQNGDRIAVPVIYGSPERWKSTQKDGYYKDKNGAIMAPIIMFKRDSINKVRSLGNKLDANSPNLYTSWKKVYNPKNAYSNFNVLNNRIPTEQFIVNVVPDYVNISYTCTIQTYYVSQLNKIVEAINYASDAYWGNPERFKFMATIDSYSTPIEISDNTERIVKATFTLNIKGYIIPDNIQKQLTAIKKYNSKSQIIIGLEVEGVGAEFLTTQARRPQVLFPGNPSEAVAASPVNQATITYLNSNTTLSGTYVSSTTATFAAGWLTAPAGLPATSLSDFVFYVNGVLIDNSNVVSFTQSGGVSTLVLDTATLGYNLEATDVITSIGKFSV
jgi:hypothetical protein